MEEPGTPRLSPTVRFSRLNQQRDLRLDFWRGLCIVDMVLVHLVHQGLGVGTFTSTLIGDYTRFAAGGFVFVSGFCVGAIHLRRISDPSRRSKVYLGMLRRAGFILLVHYLATFTELILCPLNGKRLDLAQNLYDVIFLREGYDLLPFYVIMIALCPLMLELMRRGFWWILAAISAAAFVVGSYNPWALGFPLQHDFFPLLWQLIFVAGLLAGSQLAFYDRLKNGMKQPLLVLTIAAAVVLTVAARFEANGSILPLHLTFSKVPLSLGEAMRYIAVILALMLGSGILWIWIDGSSIAQFLNRLGRRSLGMAVIHVWVVIAALNLATRMQEGILSPLALMAMTIGAMGLIARSLDGMTTLWNGRLPNWPRPEYLVVPALTVLAFLVLGIANPANPSAPHAAPAQIAITSVRSPAMPVGLNRAAPQPVQLARRGGSRSGAAPLKRPQAS